MEIKFAERWVKTAERQNAMPEPEYGFLISGNFFLTGIKVYDLFNHQKSQFMNIENLREYCISKRNVTESFPFGDDTLVFKTGGRIFALVNPEGDLTINLKCDPALAV